MARAIAVAYPVYLLIAQRQAFRFQDDPGVLIVCHDRYNPFVSLRLWKVYHPHGPQDMLPAVVGRQIVVRLF
jgi:hypothetical protein